MTTGSSAGTICVGIQPGLELWQASTQHDSFIFFVHFRACSLCRRDVVIMLMFETAKCAARTGTGPPFVMTHPQSAVMMTMKSSSLSSQVLNLSLPTAWCPLQCYICRTLTSLNFPSALQVLAIGSCCGISVHLLKHCHLLSLAPSRGSKRDGAGCVADAPS